MQRVLSTGAKADAVRVAVRVRPLSAKERAEECEEVALTPKPELCLKPSPRSTVAEPSSIIHPMGLKDIETPGKPPASLKAVFLSHTRSPIRVNTRTRTRICT